MTYDTAKVLSQRFPQALWHTKKNKQKVLDVWRKEGGVLFGCGMDTGLDLKGDLCRLNVVLKSGFPSMGDLWVIKRFYSGILGQRQYENDAMRLLIQALGRSVRSANDWSITIFTDNRLFKTIQRRWGDLPSYFKEALEEGFDVSSPTKT